MKPTSGFELINYQLEPFRRHKVENNIRIICKNTYPLTENT